MIEEFNIDYWRDAILDYDKDLSTIISENGDRTAMSKELLSNIREFVEDVIAYIYCYNNDVDDYIEYNIKTKGKSYCGHNSDYNFLPKMLEELDGTSGHHHYLADYNDRVFMHFYFRLIDIKNLLRDKFNLIIFKKLDRYPINLDNTFYDYYVLVKNILPNEEKKISYTNDSYYVYGKKKLYIDGEIIYEYTLYNANDHNNKFDGFVAFSKINIFKNYCIKATFEVKYISLFNSKIEILVITGYNVAIRNCEIIKLFNILFKRTTNYDKNENYYNLMEYIKTNKMSLSEIMLLNTEDFNKFENQVFIKKSGILFSILLKCRKIIKTKENGHNIILYLLYHMNNVILKKQIPTKDDNSYYNLCLTTKSFPFDKNPLSTSLYSHNPRIEDIIKIFPYKDNPEELLARIIKNTSIRESKIYLNLDKTVDAAEIDSLIDKYNSQFYNEKTLLRHIHRKDNFISLYVNEYETIEVMKLLINYSRTKSYTLYEENAEFELNSYKSELDEDQYNTLLKMFKEGDMFAIYGGAGTGKSYIARYVLRIFKDTNVVCLAETNPAVENVRRKIGEGNAKYMTVYDFIKNFKDSIDLLIIDECSTVGTHDMLNILRNHNPKYILLMGDPYQLKSIKFGNWFALLKEFITRKNFSELKNLHRCNTNNLKHLYGLVRKLDNKLFTYMTNIKISHPLDEHVFEKTSDDEVLLCLNYNGLYGINNVNKMMQKKNNNQPFYWKEMTFKVDDPILFCENYRFKNVFYNNLKGVIKNIVEDTNKFTFTVLVERRLNPVNCSICGINLIALYENSAICSFDVYKYNHQAYDDDFDENMQIPFHISYAISVHKAQGLEFESVKFIISNDIEEKVTFNIFYTAITRATKKLGIYWTPKTENVIMAKLKIDDYSDDVNILKPKLIK